MSYTTEPMPTAHVRRIVALSAAGQTAAQIAKTLIDEGVPVPRAGGHPSNWPEHGVVTRRSRPASNRPARVTAPPSTWWTRRSPKPATATAWPLSRVIRRGGRAAVAQVLAAPEASPTNNYAAARAKLGSDSSTTLSVD